MNWVINKKESSYAQEEAKLRFSQGIPAVWINPMANKTGCVHCVPGIISRLPIVFRLARQIVETASPRKRISRNRANDSIVAMQCNIGNAKRLDNILYQMRQKKLLYVSPSKLNLSLTYKCQTRNRSFSHIQWLYLTQQWSGTVTPHNVPS